jgi:hypothetical protein
MSRTVSARRIRTLQIGLDSTKRGKQPVWLHIPDEADQRSGVMSITIPG